MYNPGFIFGRVGTQLPRSFSPSSIQRNALALRRNLLFAVVLSLVASCDTSGPVSPKADGLALAKTPSDGNGNKLVFPIDEEDVVDCGADEFLNVHFAGWIQVRIFDEPVKRNVELAVYHVVATFTNTSGQTYKFNDAGPDRYYLENGSLIVASSGRIGGGLIGHRVINLTTGETEFIAGKEFAGVEALACEALT